MSQGFPSMTALLGLLAVAGYQNRDKIAEMLGGLGGGPGGAAATAGGPGHVPQVGRAGAGQAGAGTPGGLGGLLSGLGGGAAGAGAGGFLSGGVGELVERFRQAGQGPVVDSWVNHGQNQPVQPAQLEQAIGPDVLATLSQRTGLSRDELLQRLSRELPDAVDRYTPHGRLPTEADFTRAS